MQTTRSQSDQAHQKIAPSIFDSEPISRRPLRKNSNFRLWLSVAVFYPFALFLTLFTVVVLRHGPPTKMFIFNASAVLLVSVGFLVFSYLLVNAILRERKNNQKALSRAACLTAISDIIHSINITLREKMKRIARLLSVEGDEAGWRCRVVLKEDPFLLPPSGKNLGFHVPMTVEGKTLGALIVNTGGRPVSFVDADFFASLAQMLGHFLYKDKIWDDFHAEVERVQAVLLLNTNAPSATSSTEETLTVEYLLRGLGVLNGSVENSVDNKL